MTQVLRTNLKILFTRNQAWAQGMTEKNPVFFNHLSKQQSPDYLWIGCVDSRAPANQGVDLDPREAPNVYRTTIVQDAWNVNNDLSVHGSIYSINNGLLKDLDTEVSDTNLFLRLYSLDD